MLNQKLLAPKFAQSVTKYLGVRAASNIRSPKFDPTEWHTVVCSNGAVACWHPAKRFPYEHSRPIDEAEVASDRKLLAQARRNADKLREGRKPWSSEGPDPRSLQEIFYTDKHEWYPRPRETRLYRTSAPIARPKRSTRNTPEK